MTKKINVDEKGQPWGVWDFSKNQFNCIFDNPKFDNKRLATLVCADLNSYDKKENNYSVRFVDNHTKD